MFIICPKCSAKYKIPEGIQLESGQKLKCSACDFVFLKGEEAPFTLEKDIISSESPEQISPVGETFSEPLHSADELKTVPADSLPEAFKPVENPIPKKKKGAGIVLLYLVFVVALCVFGWMYRDSLKPSLKTIFPPLTLDKDKMPPKIRQNALPIRTQRVLPTNQPVVTVTDLSNKEKKSFQKKHPQKKAILPKPIEQKTSVRETLSVPDKKESPKTRATSKEIIPAKVITQPEIILPDPTLPSVEPESIPVPEPEVIPLFEVIDSPIPAGTATELSATAISFRIEPTEEGVEQVLIEGNIQNNASGKKSVPVLTVLALNKEGQVLSQKKVHTASDSLEAGEQIPFYTSMIPVPDNLDHVEVKF